jgi:acylglycerol lipase
MEATRSSLTTKDGTKLFIQYWKPQGTPKLIVIQSHGLGDHSGRYQHVGDLFAANGIALWGFDHRGHGKSDGKRGHIPNYEVNMEELDLMVAEAAKVFPGIPQALYGHSYGGNIALNYLIRRQPNFKAAIVTDPWLKIPKVPALQEMMAKVVNGIIPGLTQNNKIDANDLSHDKAIVKAYQDDPLVHPRISVRLYNSTAEAAQYALANADKVKVPLLLMHGTGDVITLKEGTQEFDKGVKAKHKLVLWEGMKHEVHNEVEKAKVLDEMLKFLVANVA